MTNQGEPLAALRAAIKRRISARLVIAELDMPENVREDIRPAEYENDAARKALDAELATVEARIGRLVRFVKAWDFYDQGGFSWEAYDYALARDELREARAALTESDL